MKRKMRSEQKPGTFGAARGGFALLEILISGVILSLSLGTFMYARYLHAKRTLELDITTTFDEVEDQIMVQAAKRVRAYLVAVSDPGQARCHDQNLLPASQFAAIWSAPSASGPPRTVDLSIRSFIEVPSANTGSVSAPQTVRLTLANPPQCDLIPLNGHQTSPGSLVPFSVQQTNVRGRALMASLDTTPVFDNNWSLRTPSFAPGVRVIGSNCVVGPAGEQGILLEGAVQYQAEGNRYDVVAEKMLVNLDDRSPSIEILSQ